MYGFFEGGEDEGFRVCPCSYGCVRGIGLPDDVEGGEALGGPGRKIVGRGSWLCWSAGLLLRGEGTGFTLLPGLLADIGPVPGVGVKLVGTALGRASSVGLCVSC